MVKIEELEKNIKSNEIITESDGAFDLEEDVL